MVTQNAQLVANSIMAEAIENWLNAPMPTGDEMFICRLERKLMSSWSKREIALYTELTGQEIPEGGF